MNKHLIRYLLAATLSLGATGQAWAIKATPHAVTVTQPDGSKLVIRIHGDEHFHYITTGDGFLIQRDADGFFKYVQTEPSKGVRRLSKQRASNIGKRSATEVAFTNTLKPIRAKDAEWLKTSLLADTKPILSSRTLPASVTNRKVDAETKESKESEYLVVLVKYSDGEFHFAAKDFDRWLNEKGYAVNGGTGSVKDYYRDNSMGAFIPNFTVVGPYTLDHERTYYAADVNGTGNDCNPYAAVTEAVEKAKADHPEIDFSKFDNDHDGYMDNVNVIIGGYSQASTGDAKDMWPHSSRLDTDTLKVDGITVSNYSVSAELVGYEGVNMDGIGTFVHEFGHILGLKDMYDTDDYDNGLGIDLGDFSLYSSGSYNNSSRTPPCLMAFERNQMGWLKTEDMHLLNKAEDVVLDTLSNNAAAYINAQPNLDKNDGHEWFVLENRQKTGWDAYIPYHGLLITHYDYTKDKQTDYWSVNGPNNNARHRCLYIVAADGVDDDNSRKGDTYPGTTGNTEFTDDSTPAARNWLDEKLRTPITDIREEGGKIYFQVKGGTTERSSILTQKPDLANISSSSIRIQAKLGKATQDITEMGFCWSDETEEPSLGDDSQHRAVATANQIETTIDGLDAASLYYVRAYMKLADGTTVMGAALPVRTEHEVMKAPLQLTFDDKDDDGDLAYWNIVDNNGDGVTWAYDKTIQGMVYNADYWNNADDWLVSEKMHIPEHGSLYVLRGVNDASSVEKLDVYVSTKSRNVSDFHLVKSFSLADQFGEMAVDETDLSDFAGKDVYVALVCKSERLQNALWLWGIMLTQRLDAPTITKFERSGEKLAAEWTPVDGAQKYYLEFFKETDKAKSTTKYLPEDDVNEAIGDVELGTGTFRFTGSGSVESIAYPGNITGIQYVLKSGGPRGTSTFSVEGSNDGQQWTRIGELQKITGVDSDGQDVDLKTYLKDKTYNRLRLSCEFNGRMVDIRNFSITYDDGTVLDTLAAGSSTLTHTEISPLQSSDEFDTGKYMFRVYAGDGLLFYDASAPAYYSKEATGINEAAATTLSGISPARALCAQGIVRLAGLTPGHSVSLYATDGRLLLRFTPTSTTAAVKLEGYEGVVIIK